MECGHAAASDVARRRALQHRGRPEAPESTIGGQATPCIVCFVNPKSHAAVPHAATGAEFKVQSLFELTGALALIARPRCPVCRAALCRCGCMYVRRDDFERERVLHATRLDVVIRSLL